MMVISRMNKFLAATLVLTLLSACMEIDNFDAPAGKISGRLIDKTTGQNLLLDQAETHIRIWEYSYSLNPEPQDLAVKMDGTYKNTKLFNGTYDMQPYDGSWWPAEIIQNVRIGKKGTVQDFEVIPYLHLEDFSLELNGLALTMSCRLHAPVVTGMPNVVEIRPFLSLNQYCGNTNRIDYYYSDDYKIRVQKPWSALDDGTGYSRETYSVTVPVKPGYTYWCRMGAQVKNTFTNYNYSKIVKVTVPQDAE